MEINIVVVGVFMGTIIGLLYSILNAITSMAQPVSHNAFPPIIQRVGTTKYNQQHEDAVKKLHKEGKTHAQISEMTKVPKSSINYLINGRRKREPIFYKKDSIEVQTLKEKVRKADTAKIDTIVDKILKSAKSKK
jgi:hypothetical protein